MIFLCIWSLANIYYDYAATTPCRHEVVAYMNRLYAKKLGNPNANHKKGIQAQCLLKSCEETLAKLVNGSHVVWTSGATEANNTAILCTQNSGITVTCETEHKSILESVAAQSKSHVLLKVDKSGHINLDDLEHYLSNFKVRLVSFMYVNNETGVIHRIEKIGHLCHKYGVLFHVDAAQAFGKICIDMKAEHIDMLTISGHKIYGPQGIGGLILSDRGLRAIQNKRLMFGGAPQLGVRAGTIPVVLVAGFVEASSIAHSEIKKAWWLAQYEKSKMWKIIKKRYPETQINGKTEWPYILSVRVPKRGRRNPCLEMSKRYIFSNGSACSKGASSYVMHAMGLNTQAFHTMRFSFSGIK